jgi:hypothetical protein
MTKTRDEIATLVCAAPGMPPAWRIETAPVRYEDALAFMEARAAAIASGDDDELVWLIEHPARAPNTLSRRGFRCLRPAAVVSSPITDQASASPMSCST